MRDQDYMKIALRLASKGRGWTAPNPMVGAVIVKDGRIIGQGWHERYGGPHAERNALASCTESPRGATLYVTLEPCCHYGKQPPCVNAVLDAGITRVVVGAGDPNPLVSGKGNGILREHGVEVTEGVLGKECMRLNQIFFHYIQSGIPFVTLKYAMTLDGKIAAYTGKSRWITGKEAREHAHYQRHVHSAVMIGVGTVLADDPLLTCRLPECKNPLRVICDSHLRTPLTARVIQTAETVPTLLATCRQDRERIALYEAAGCHVLTVPEVSGQVDLKALLRCLGEEKIDSVLLEGGGTLAWSALQAGAVRRVQTYLAPLLLGGKTAKSPVEGTGFPDPDHGILLESSRILHLGQDWLIESEVAANVYGDC